MLLLHALCCPAGTDPSEPLGAKDFARSHFRGFNSPGDVTPASLHALAATGANAVRVFLSLRRTAHGYEVDPSSAAQLEQVIAGSGGLGFGVIICLMPPDREFFRGSALQDSVASIWQEQASRYRSQRTVLAFDLMNEPIDPDSSGGEKWSNIALRWILAIRQVDPARVIVFEPAPGAIPEAFRQLKPLEASNVVYSVHMYEPYEFTHQGLMGHDRMSYPAPASRIGPVDRATLGSALRPVAAFAESYRVPILVGEFGAVGWAPEHSTAAYLDDLLDLFERSGYSWIYHAWRNYQGWDAELPGSWFASFPLVDGKPRGFEKAWPPPRTAHTDSFDVLRRHLHDIH